MHSMKTELSQEYTPAAEPHIGTVPIEQKANGRGEMPVSNLQSRVYMR